MGVPGGYLGGTLIYPLLMGMGVLIYTHYMYLWGYLYIHGEGRGGREGGTYIYLLYMCMCICLYTYYICVCACAYIHAIYMYVQRFIYILYMCMLYQWGVLYKGMGGAYIGGGCRVGQSARRQCTLFNFQRLPQYTNSRVVYKGLGVGCGAWAMPDASRL